VTINALSLERLNIHGKGKLLKDVVEGDKYCIGSSGLR